MASSQALPGLRRKPLSIAAPAVLMPIFTTAFIVLIILPSLMSAQFGPYPLMKVEDVFLLLTPLVMIPLYWEMLSHASQEKVGAGAMVLFLALAAVWVDGHGIKLAANSIGHLLGSLENTDAFRLTYFYDEILGHYWWHAGILSLSALVVAREWRSHRLGAHSLGLPVGLGILHGLSLFLIIVEGQTVPLGLPFALLFVLAALVWGRRHLGEKPWLAFFTTAYAAALVLFAAWWLYWGEFIEIFDAMTRLGG